MSDIDQYLPAWGAPSEEAPALPKAKLLFLARRRLFLIVKPMPLQLYINCTPFKSVMIYIHPCSCGWAGFWGAVFCLGVCVLRVCVKICQILLPRSIVRRRLLEPKKWSRINIGQIVAAWRLYHTSYNTNIFVNAAFLFAIGPKGSKHSRIHPQSHPIQERDGGGIWSCVYRSFLYDLRMSLGTPDDVLAIKFPCINYIFHL